MWTLCAAALLVPATGLLLLGVLALFLERKLIGLAQKRLGISFLGRNGWAHLPADLVKFWLKHTARHGGSWLTPGAGVVGSILAYLTWSLAGCVFFVADAAGAPVDFWDLQLLAYFGYANLTTLFMYNVVVGLRSKYATVAGARVLLTGVFVEVFFVLCFLLLAAHGGGFALDDVGVAAQRGVPAAALPPLALFFVLYALFEAKRAPFDHSEAESELVAGHLVEFGGRALLFFYMCEYVHLFFCLYLVALLCVGATAAPTAAALWPYFAEEVCRLGAL